MKTWLSVIFLGLLTYTCHAQTDTCSLSRISQDGDVIFGIFSNIHEQDVNDDDTTSWCGQVSLVIVEMLSATLWILDKLSGTYIPGIDIGESAYCLTEWHNAILQKGYCNSYLIYHRSEFKLKLVLEAIYFS